MQRLIKWLLKLVNKSQTELVIDGYTLDWDTFCFIFFLLDYYKIDCNHYNELLLENDPRAINLRNTLKFRFKNKHYYEIVIKLIRFHNYDIKHMRSLYNKRMFEKYLYNRGDECSVNLYKENIFLNEEY